jgi:cytidine deaminase
MKLNVIFSVFCLIAINQGHSVIDDITKTNLVNEAIRARQFAYAPYSNFQVGAALLATDGTIYNGCNVENASFCITCCAERTALFKAISEGKQTFTAIAISVPGGGTPCGACRQALNEFNPELQVIYTNEDGSYTAETTLNVLFPESFGPHNLKK